MFGHRMSAQCLKLMFKLLNVMTKTFSKCLSWIVLKNNQNIIILNLVYVY